ncbi:hypothetical protein [Deferribacter abyssi]|uniref:hypothetical protein n=1 Tax=Deferribacter abyssi TaxID=213806 RepID=UPI003C1B6DDE
MGVNNQKLIDVLTAIYSKNSNKILFVKAGKKTIPVASVENLLNLIGQPDEIIIKSNKETFVIKG